MKIELHICGKETAAMFAEFMPRYYAALEKDSEVNMRQWGVQPDEQADPVGAPTPAAAAAAAEEPKAKRGRKAAAEKEVAPADVLPATNGGGGTPASIRDNLAEPEPSIRATPEDRQPVETVEDAVIVGTPSLDDLKAAMAKVQEARGMPWLVANVGELLGAPRASAVAEGDRAAAIARLEEAARG